MNKYDTNNKRWGEYIPFLFRTTDVTIQYESAVCFLDLICPAIQRHFKYNEANIPNINHFEELLVSDTFNRYKINILEYKYQPWYRISNYFSQSNIRQDVINDFPELKKAGFTYGTIDITSKDYTKSHFVKYFIERVHTLEVMLHNLPNDNNWVVKLKKDANRFFAISKIPLIYDLNLNLIKPLEEPLLQNIIDTALLPRINAISPERANEFILFYHEMLGDKPTDEIFIGAFKTLEEFTRLLTSDNKFEFKKEYLRKYYPDLHPTIVTTIEKLNAHRGDEAGHGKNAPEEIRYLLFAIFNIALLLLDYKEFHKK